MPVVSVVRMSVTLWVSGSTRLRNRLSEIADDAMLVKIYLNKNSADGASTMLVTLAVVVLVAIVEVLGPSASRV